MDNKTLWERYKKYLFTDAETGLHLDISRVNFPDNFFESTKGKMDAAYDAMQKLESGAIANPDENRTVGHYWLRNPGLAPDAKLKEEIETTFARMNSFAKDVHSGKIAPEAGGKYQHLLLIGIGGSALGPQFVTKALGSPNDPIDAYFFDNTDPDGMEKVLKTIPDLSRTLCVVISKSGGTKETRNGMLIAKLAWETAGFNFAKNFIAITCPGSELDKVAVGEKWLERFPMWDWVGGRTSELSAVGMLAAALQGFSIDEIHRGAREIDELTRRKDTMRNPAALLSLMWYFLGEGRGAKDMVILPYSDRLELFSRYLQQLVMESLGKEKDLSGKVVNQGIAVYGNKGSTDQHAYVQQLRDGVNNFYSVFIEVLKDSCKKTSNGKSALSPQFSASTYEVEPGVTAGDYLSGFFQGTRRALFEKQRQSITITVPEVNEYTVGALIALFERAVGFYATLININAYDQPGVEAGKKAAAQVLSLQAKIVAHLKKGESGNCTQIAQAIGDAENTESVYLILRHLAANGKAKRSAGANVFEDKYSA